MAFSGRRGIQRAWDNPARIRVQQRDVPSRPARWSGFAEIILNTLMVILMIVAPPTFMFGLAIREQRLSS
ncbi:hypothetical protein LJR225_001846 [Phenylobacterium sp. LjRoot225]|uniref:hypothetical protein n=1 Tax=Phenylobacterium sp. LjRoot225 TaxID=3342285 RepID=UPI003ECECB33